MAQDRMTPAIEPRRATPAEPYAPTERASERSDDGRSSERAAERRVLVIEDEPDIRDLLSYNLQSGGFQVKTADTGTNC